MTILLAVLLGTSFGFVLQRIGAADPDEILDMLTLHGLRLMKTIILGIGVASALLFVGMAVGLVDPGHLEVKAAYVGVPIGGLVLGAGWGLSGFCPGTAVAAAGAGRKDALAFILGGLVGAGLFMEAYAGLADTIIFREILGGKSTLARAGAYEPLIRANGLVVAIVLAAGLIALAFVLPNRFRMRGTASGNDAA